MKRLILSLAACAALLSLASFSTPAEAHGRVRGGVHLHFGVPWHGWYWGPRFYYAPRPYYFYDEYYVPPAVIVERHEPPVYVERSDYENESTPAPAQQQQPKHWWYWCAASEKYYPYVKECPGGFQRVPPQPVSPSR